MSQADGWVSMCIGRYIKYVCVNSVNFLGML